MSDFNPVDLFTTSSQNIITEVDVVRARNINDLIKIRAASDKSYRIRRLIQSWAMQQTQERQLRTLYAKWFIYLLAAQLFFMFLAFFLMGFQFFVISDMQFNTFFISSFGEIVSLVLIVTKYLFSRSDDVKILETLKDM
jgi:hypothetical protein